MRIFFDTSSFAKRYISEAGTEEVADICERVTELGLSVICFSELVSTMSRLKREKKITLAQYKKIKDAIHADIESADICNLTPSVVHRSIEILESNSLRAMDALHIACAVEWFSEVFVSSDKQQIKAAKKQGLAVKLI